MVLNRVQKHPYWMVGNMMVVMYDYVFARRLLALETIECAGNDFYNGKCSMKFPDIVPEVPLGNVDRLHLPTSYEVPCTRLS